MEEQIGLTVEVTMTKMTSLEPEFDVESMEGSFAETNLEGVMEAEPVELESAHSQVGDEVLSDMVMNVLKDAFTDTTEANTEMELAGSSVEEVLTEDAKDEVKIDVAEIVRIVPDKMAFKIGEVAEITGLKPYVLRYWESEFDALTPQKSAFNQRMYSKRDVETVLLIKKLLYDEKFSIAGAKKKLKELRKELKVEKKRVETLDRFDQAVEMVENLALEIAELKRLFA